VKRTDFLETGLNIETGPNMEFISKTNLENRMDRKNFWTRFPGLGYKDSKVHFFDLIHIETSRMKALLAALMRVFEKKFFGGQEQYINKQTGYTADCNEMKTFLQREMNSQNCNFYPYQNNYPNYG